MSPNDQAAANFESHIEKNAYPGRGLVVGQAEEGGFLFVYWIMGRSPNSQNRRFAVDGNVLRTEPVDLSKVEDPSLIIYDAMLELPDVQLVSNGDQTRTVYDALAEGRGFESALLTREREPDAPNFTPRITGMLDFRSGSPELTLAILKASATNPDLSDRIFYRPAMPPAGIGRALTTYMADGSPLPSFVGDPLLLPLSGSPKAVLSQYFNALNSDNRISVAVKHMATDGATLGLHVCNRHDDQSI